MFKDLFQQASFKLSKTDEEIKAEFRAAVHRHVNEMAISAAMLPVLLFGAGWGAMQLTRGIGATKRRREASWRNPSTH